MIPSVILFGPILIENETLTTPIVIIRKKENNKLELRDYYKCS